MDNLPPKILAKAAFTKDMAETLVKYFANYEKDGIVRLDVTDHGLWIKHPDFPIRNFLGAAELPDHIKARLARGNH